MPSTFATSTTLPWDMVAGGANAPSSYNMSSSSFQWPTGERRQHIVELEAQDDLDREVEMTTLRRQAGLRAPPRDSYRSTYQTTFIDADRYSSEMAYRRAVEVANSDMVQYSAQARRQNGLEVTADQASRPRSSRLPGQHRVYLINCKHCNHFITDRGMKAVLLLRPHITLYSTDATPNCGPLYPDSNLGDPSSCQDPTVERTCNCLTQTLGCYGCGVAVGYHIVSPCSRCTSSVSKHQRSSNGHRTVLHCTEISVRERRYVPGEKGVMAAKVHYPTPRSNARIAPRTDLYSQLFATQRHLRRHSVSEEFFQDEESKEQTFLPYADVMEQEHRQAVAQAQASEAAANSQSLRNGDSKRPRLMKAGDTVYWSDLVTGGERYEPIDCDEILAMPTCSR